LSAAQMQKADRWAIETLGVPGLTLMENAGRGVVRLILRKLSARDLAIRGLPIAVVCGAGYNAGDGFVIARHLAQSGARVKVLRARRGEKIAGYAAENAAAAERITDIEWVDASREQDEAAWQRHLSGAAVIVDAIFGTGLRSDVSGVPAAAIQAINRSS